jgi:AcrR family transcriptional regulator
MPRPQAFTDDQLLAAAREVFLERGVLATTAEVAARAGVAEGTLFYRFKTKAALFQAALRPDMEEPHWLASLEALAATEDLEAALCSLGVEVLTHFRKAVPLLMLQGSNPLPARAAAGAPAGPGEHAPAQAVRRLSAFFEAHMRAGRLRPAPPDVTARVFLGGFMNYAFHEAMAPEAATPHAPAEPYVREVVALLLSGLAPTPQAPAVRTPRRPSRKGKTP